MSGLTPAAACSVSMIRYELAESFRTADVHADEATSIADNAPAVSVRVRLRFMADSEECVG